MRGVRVAPETSSRMPAGRREDHFVGSDSLTVWSPGTEFWVSLPLTFLSWADSCIC